MYRCVVLLLCFFNLLESYYSEKSKLYDSCREYYNMLTFCESPCVVQVGLSVVRVTFNKYIVNEECVKEASIVYWISNSTEESANEMILNNFEEIYPKDCTYHRNNHFNFKSREQVNVKNHTSTNVRSDFEKSVQNDNRYVYLYGLMSGVTYSIKTKVILKTQIRTRSVFSSLTTEISLSKNELFKSDGLVGHVNQGRCCDIRNFTYKIDSQTGECRFQLPFPEAHTSLSTYVMTSLILTIIPIVVLGIIYKLCSSLRQRRGVQIDGYHAPEVSFHYLDPQDVYQDLSTPRPYFTLNRKLLRSPTVANRLPPDGEEIEFEELNKKFKCQSI